MDISYDRLSRKVNFKVGEETYSIRYTLAALEELERRIPGNRGVVEIITDAAHMSLGVLVTGLAVGISYGLNKPKKDTAQSRDDIEKLATTICIDEGPQALMVLFYCGIAVSGLFGPDASKSLMEQFGLNCRDETPKNGENGEAAAP